MAEARIATEGTETRRRHAGAALRAVWKEQWPATSMRSMTCSRPAATGMAPLRAFATPWRSVSSVRFATGCEQHNED